MHIRTYTRDILYNHNRKKSKTISLLNLLFSLSLSHLGVVLALLPFDTQIRKPNHHVALSNTNRASLKQTQDRHLPGNPGRGVEPDLTRQHVPDKLAQLRYELLCLDRDPARDPLGPPRSNPAGGDICLADLFSTVEDEALAGAVAEGDTVGVVDEDEEVEGEVELDSDGWEGDAWGDAGDVGGEESGGGVLGLEEDEEEDENDGDEEDDEEEGGGCDDAAAGEAPGWRLFWLEGLGVGYFCHVAQKMRDRKAMRKVEEKRGGVMN